MKKLYTKEKYKKYNLKKILKGNRKRNKKIKKNRPIFYMTGVDIRDKIDAPPDFRLFENPIGCLTFFRDIRKQKNFSRIRNLKFIEIDLSNVTEIDYGTISILTAISDDLKYKNIILKGNFPNNKTCKQKLESSGFLEHMVNEKGNRFKKVSKSKLIFFEKGTGKLTTKDSIRISEFIKDIVGHLTGEKAHSQNLKTLLLEICGNSIEWSKTNKQQWLLGAKFKKDRVIITVTDVGQGILKTLHRKFDNKLIDFIKFKSDLDILIGAFNKKYGSTSKDVNRNKGLPSIKYNLEQNKIENVKVVTNNVILQLNNKNKSLNLGKGSPRFKGTFFEMEFNKNNIIKINNVQN